MAAFPGRLWIVFILAGALAVMALGPEASFQILATRWPALALFLLSTALFAQNATTVRLAGRGELLSAHGLAAGLALLIYHRSQFLLEASLGAKQAWIVAALLMLAFLALITIVLAMERRPRITRGLLLSLVFIGLGTCLPWQGLRLSQLLCGARTEGATFPGFYIAAVATAALFAWRVWRGQSLETHLERSQGRPLKRAILSLPLTLAHVALAANGGLVTALIASSLFPYLASFGTSTWKAIHGRALALALLSALIAWFLALATTLPQGIPLAGLLVLSALCLHLGERRMA